MRGAILQLDRSSWSQEVNPKLTNRSVACRRQSFRLRRLSMRHRGPETVNPQSRFHQTCILIPSEVQTYRLQRLSSRVSAIGTLLAALAAAWDVGVVRGFLVLRHLGRKSDVAGSKNVKIGSGAGR